MISKDKITEIFCIADDFCKEFENEVAKKALLDSNNTRKRRRKRMMSDAEVITILICFHFNSYRNFKHYYLQVSDLEYHITAYLWYDILNPKLELLSNMCAYFMERFVSTHLFVQSIYRGYATLFCCNDPVLKIGIIWNMHRD